MNYSAPEEVMDSLMGRTIKDWGSDGQMYHFILDDGRVLIFMALGIVMENADVIH